MAGEFYGKIILAGTMKVLTGMHIGANSEGMDIGGIDSPVVRDPITRYPYIPGSSLKGKLRSLFERSQLAQNKLQQGFNRNGGRGIKRHECSDSNCEVCRLFGATGLKQEDANQPARLTVRDCKLTDDSADRLKQVETGLYMTEWKFENGLDRITAAANPRQLERIPAGAEFGFEFAYTVSDKKQIREDIKNLFMFVRILEDDYLGGHGSRGYGQINFKLSDISIKTRAVYAGEEDVVKISRLFEEFIINDSQLKQITESFA